MTDDDPVIMDVEIVRPGADLPAQQVEKFLEDTLVGWFDYERTEDGFYIVEDEAAFRAQIGAILDLSAGEIEVDITAVTDTDD